MTHAVAIRGRRWMLRGLTLGVATAAGLSCTDRVPERAAQAAGPVVARVNDAVLREDELKDALPGFLGDTYTDGGRNEFVEQWVEGELLYQKALEEGLQRDGEIRRKVDQFERMLLQQEVLRRFLEREIVVTDEEITRYYDENIEGFRRETDECQVARLVFPEEERARQVAGELEVAPERFDELIASEAYAGRVTLQDLGRYAVSEMEGVFGNGRGDLKVGDLSAPVVAGPGNCYVLRVMAVLEEGSVRERDEVADRIRGILLRRKGEEARQAWVEELKRSARVEIAAQYGG